MRIESQGFFDLQVNGFAGVDFNNPDCSAEELQHATDQLRATGVTRYLPTLVTSSLEWFARCAQVLLQFVHPAIAGIHMEGPYISPQDGARGAHARAHVIPASIEDFESRQEAARGCIRMVTLAPEVPGALSLIEHLVASDVRVAIGHTNATTAQIRAAIHAGATLSTHLGNGCAQTMPRHPNFIWEQLAADELYASFIVDGHHLPAATVKTMVRAKTAARTILVTDAMAAAGCAPGSYLIGNVAVELSPEGRVSEPGAAHLAGSALSMQNAVANTVCFTGLSLEEVLPMASTQPARYLGLETAGRVVAEWDQSDCRLSVVQVTTGDG